MTNVTSSGIEFTRLSNSELSVVSMYLIQETAPDAFFKGIKPGYVGMGVYILNQKDINVNV